MKFRLLLGIAIFSISLSAPGYLQAQALTGSKTIGAGGDYASLAAAITDMNTKGVSGSLTFLINSDLTETGLHEITTTTLAGANKLLIKPAAGKTPVITFGSLTSSGNGGNACLAVSGTSTNVGNITIDGSNTDGGATRDLTFAINDGTAGRYVIRLNGETDNITIKNLKIQTNAMMATASSGTRTYGIYSVASSTAAADNLTITNCQIGSSAASFYYGIYKPDGGTIPFGNSLNISNNIIYAQHKGMSVWGTDGISNINNNSVSVIGHPTGAYVQNSINGIYVESWKGTLNVFNNKIITLKAKALTQTSAKPLYGILVYYATGTGITGQTANVYNNFISDFSYTGDASTLTTNPSEIDGIAVDATDQTVNVYYNTVYINGENITTNPTAGIRVYDDAGLSANLKNNIVVNAVNNEISYAVYADPIVNGCLKSSDYNDFFVVGAKANLAYYNGVKQNTLAGWKTATGKDANSININPVATLGAAGQLTSVVDLHWVSKPAASFAGTQIALVLKDIDGDTRSTSKPYMGADEGASLTAVQKQDDICPDMFSLNQNYPNPFNPVTVISFNLKEASDVSLKVYDILGREAATLVNSNLTSGIYTVNFDASKLASGVYIYTLKAGKFIQTRTMILNK